MEEGAGRRTDLKLTGGTLKQPPRSASLFGDSIGQHLP